MFWHCELFPVMDNNFDNVKKMLFAAMSDNAIMAQTVAKAKVCIM